MVKPNWNQPGIIDLSSGEKVDNGEPMLGIEDLIEQHALDDSPGSAIESSPVSEAPSLLYSPSPGITAADPSKLSNFRTPIVPPHQAVVTLTKPVPPPTARFHKRDATADQKVVQPSKESCNSLPILVPSIPEGGTKSRVETQVRVTVDLATALPSPQDPTKYDRVGSWKWLKLPPGTSTKRQSRKQGTTDPDPQDILYLNVGVTCATAPYNTVHCCSSCQTREAKRVAKKIAARVKPEPSESDSADEQGGKAKRAKRPSHEDTSSIVHFNCADYLDFSTGSVVLPLRLTCYCRHHREKLGFNVHFSMVDHTGRTVGIGVSRPIMITDDHKTARNANNTANANGLEMTPVSEFHHLSQGADHQWAKALASEKKDVKAPSKRKSVSGAQETATSKRRAKPYDNSRSSKASREGSVASAPSPSSSQPGSATRSPSPVAQSPHLSLSLGMVNDMLAELPSTSSPIYDIPPSHMGSLFHLPDLPMPPAVDDLGPVHNPIFAPPSPSQITPQAHNPNDNMTQSIMAPAMPFMFFPHPSLAHPPVLPNNGLPIPRVQRMIPACGPTHGGIEVTILGTGFHPGLDLRCVFGDVVSHSTHRWSDNTLVCVLPPRQCAGVVHVWFDGFKMDETQSIPAEALFTYSDESDRALMELALQVVGLKMTGKIEDAKNVAMRIVGNTGDNNGAGSSSMSSIPGSSLALSQLRDVHPLLLASGDSGAFEDVIIDFLTMLDLDMDEQAPSSSRVTVKSAVSHQNATGQSMLHLACMLGLSKLVEFLLVRGADPDARDRNGWTPSHFSALATGDAGSSCTIALLQAGADVEIVNASGRTAQEEGAILRSRAKEGDNEDAWSEALSSPRPRSIAEEDMWGDCEDSESEKVVLKKSFKKKANLRHSAFKLLSRRTSSSDLVPIIQDGTKRSEGKRKEAEAEPTSSDVEKQAATFADLFHRTLTLLHQHAPETLKGLPLPHLPTQFTDKLPIPAVPWGVLPNIPMVFPVFVPMMPGLPAFLSGDQKETKEGQPGEAPAAGVLKPADWRAMWEKWLNTMTPSTPKAELPPPVYTPRAGEDETVHVDSKDVSLQQVISPQAQAVASSSKEDSQVLRSRRPVYTDVPVTAQEVNSFTYQPTTKQKKMKKKHDPMLIMFWIPTLVFSLLWACYHGVHFALSIVKDVVSLRAITPT